nr:MAG TPA_asm: hypothetical protein [Caudoviricetes sp.]
MEWSIGLKRILIKMDNKRQTSKKECAEISSKKG